MADDYIVESTTDKPEDVIAANLKEAADAAKDEAANKPVDKSKDESPADDNDPDEVEDDENEDDEDGEVEDAKPDKDLTKPKRKGGFQKKIDKLTEEKYRAQAEIDRRDRELAELRAKLNPAKPDDTKPEKPASTLRARPKLSDTKPDGTPKYTDYDSFLEDQGAWFDESVAAARDEAKLTAKAEHDRLKAEEKAEAARLKAADDDTKLKASWTERQNAAKVLHADYDTVVLQNESLQISPVMHYLMFTHPLGAELAYWAGSNPDKYAAIHQLSQEQQFVGLGGVLRDLERDADAHKSEPSDATPAKPRVKASKAPKPAAPKPAGKTGATVKDDAYWANAPYDEYKAHMDAKEAAAKAAR